MKLFYLVIAIDKTSKEKNTNRKTINGEKENFYLRTLLQS